MALAHYRISCITVQRRYNPYTNPKNQGKTDGSMGPPLTVLAKRPVRRKHRRLVLLICDRLLRFMKPVEAREEFVLVPLRTLLDPPQLPLPQRILS